MSHFIEENKEAYNAIATPFSQSRTFRFGELPLLLEHVQSRKVIVDLGCGTGRLYQLLVQNQALRGDVVDDQNVLGVRYVGIDQSVGQLEAAKKDFPEAEWLEGEMTLIPMSDESVDIIYCIATFHHLPDDKSRLEALKEMHRILKPGGKLVMSNWNFESDWVKSKLEGPDTPGIESKWERDGDHFFVPWMNPKREVLGIRHYWALYPDQLTQLHTKVGFVLDDWYYTRQDKRVNDVKLGMNIVTIAIK